MATQYISADVVVPVLRALRELGADVSKFRPTTTGLGGSEVDELMDEAAEQLGPAVGLRVAAEIPLGALGPVDSALSTSSSVREGLHRLSRYYGVATGRVELTVFESPNTGLELKRNPAVRHNAASLEAEKGQLAVCMAVVDRSGQTLAVSRDHRAGVHTIRASYKKAYTANSQKRETAVIAEGIKDGTIPRHPISG